MTSRWVVRLSMLASVGLAIAVVALVLGREDVPTATYLAYTSEEQAPPGGGLVETPSGDRVWLAFERIEANLIDTVTARVPAGVVFDSLTYAALPRDVVSEWRTSGLILVGFDVDAVELVMGLEVWATVGPAPGQPNQFILVGGTNLDAVAGNPATIDRDAPFVGVAYRPPAAGADDDPLDVGWLGWLGWFQNDEHGLREWLAERALDAAEEYGRPLD